MSTIEFLRKLPSRVSHFLQRELLNRNKYNSLRKWRNDNAEHKRYSYNLNEDSIVFDVGGYHGEFAEKIYKKFNCNIYIFEPIKEFCKIISNKIGSNPKVNLNHFGLGAEDKNIMISNFYDSSSAYKDFQTESIECKIKKISMFLKKERINSISLLKLNIEGMEYELMEDLIENNMLGIIENFQIQFHDFVPHCHSRRKAIRKILSKTHNENWCYDFVWESWSKKK